VSSCSGFTSYGSADKVRITQRNYLEPGEKMSEQAAATYTIDSIVDQLERFRQRATYGAVAAVVNRSPRNLMDKRTRSPRDSWVVSRKDGMPSKYPPEQVHPEITAREAILATGQQLESWLANPS